jgi:hypothetical protein
MIVRELTETDHGAQSTARGESSYGKVINYRYAANVPRTPANAGVSTGSA